MIWINCGAGELCSTHIKTRLESPLCPSAACDPDFLECSFQLFSELSRDRADLWLRGLLLRAVSGNDGTGEDICCRMVNSVTLALGGWGRCYYIIRVIAIRKASAKSFSHTFTQTLSWWALSWAKDKAWGNAPGRTDCI